MSVEPRGLHGAVKRNNMVQSFLSMSIEVFPQWSLVGAEITIPFNFIFSKPCPYFLTALASTLDQPAYGHKQERRFLWLVPTEY